MGAGATLATGVFSAEPAHAAVNDQILVLPLRHVPRERHHHHHVAGSPVSRGTIRDLTVSSTSVKTGGAGLHLTNSESMVVQDVDLNNMFDG
jgi:hypothetical protein